MTDEHWLVTIEQAEEELVAATGKFLSLAVAISPTHGRVPSHYEVQHDPSLRHIRQAEIAMEDAEDRLNSLRHERRNSKIRSATPRND